MRLLPVLLFLISVISIAKADYQYAFCNFNELTIGGVNGMAHLLSEDDGATLDITFDFTTTLSQNTQFAAQILTYGYNPSSMTNLGAVFDPTNVKTLGCPTGTPRAGDIGNIAAKGGNVTSETITLTIPNIKDHANSIIGRSIAIYSGSYDCSTPSKTVLGDMISFCTIGVGNVDYYADKAKLVGVNTASSNSKLENAIGLAMVSNTTVTNGDYIEGRVLFKAINSTFIQVSAKVSGLSYQAHGFHVHQFGDTSTVDGNSIGGHFLASGQSHALPPNGTRHYGDFGNFCAFSQEMMDTGYYYYETDHVTAALVIGRGMAVHNFTDQGNNVVGGARCSQGVIALIEDQEFSLNIPSDWVWDVICQNGSYYGDMAGSMNSESYSDDFPGSSSTIVPFFALIIFSIIFALL